MSEVGISAATSWLEWLYGEKFEGNISICGHGRWAGSRFPDVASAVQYAMRFDAGQVGIGGTYHRLTTLNDSAPRRGVDEDSVMLHSVSLDLDLRGPGHVSEDYPETAEQLNEVLAAAGMPEPSAWVNSGGGRYPHWKLTTPILLTASEEEFKRGQGLLRSVQRTVAAAARERGWKLDNTSDLARVYRLPGTLNRKGETPVMVTWEIGSGRTYEPSELQPDPRPEVERAPASVPAPGSDEMPGEEMSAFMADLLGAKRPAPADAPRLFTVQQAMAYVTPELEALRTAPVGEINNRLNAAACKMAHFGPEFWDRGAAEAQLLAALGQTEYDAASWVAEDTIASAYKGMSGDWQAVLVTPPPSIEQAASSAPEDAVDALLAEMLSLDQLESAPPPKFMVHRFLQFDSESWMIGLPGSKKSFVAFSIAASVVRGEPWQGYRTNPADVVFIVAEGVSGHGKRVKAWRTRYGAVERDGRQAVFTLPRPVQAKDVGAWAVLVKACARLANRARDAGRGLLVIIDTQSRVTAGLDENSNGGDGLNHYVQAVSAIRQATAACVLSIHHTGKDGRTARGGSVIDGAQTTELKVESASGKLTARFLTEKQKDIDEAPPLDLAFEVIDVGVDDDGERLTSLVLAEAGSAEFVAAWAGAETTHEDVEDGEAARATPFKARTVLDGWIVGEVDSRAVMQHWIVQALVDTAEALGLTQSEVRGLVEEKRGKTENSTWRKAWQKVADDAGPWAHVVRPAGGQRWTVDRTGIPGAE